MSTTWSLLISLVLLALNGFFVAAEFALVASKRHRLEQAAADGSRAARAALAGVRELSLMLAGAQLGITLCTLGLGALAEPAGRHLLEPAVRGARACPSRSAYVVAFVLAVAVVSFLHVVVGEMAPKSWAISHPERSALLLALPFRAFTTVTRPVLVALNGLANACLRAGQGAAAGRAGAGARPRRSCGCWSSRPASTARSGAAEHELLTAMLAVQNTTVGQVMTPYDRVVTVAADAPAREVERISRREGRSRLAVVGAGRRHRAASCTSATPPGPPPSARRRPPSG